ncbi:MAG: tripartite tricarboxylate transporter substrate binding protein [Burkholderiales bacterium]|nr:tripartite tricarboxylate transporter substrate binding protein [Burkholderiales bacterium]
MISRRRGWSLSMLIALCAAPPLAAQSYPERSIRMIVAFPTGASQLVAVTLSDKLREALGQGVVPDFRSGAGGNLASELAAKAPSDGYTLLLTSPTIAISPSLFKKLPYDTARDFAPISLLATVPNVLVVHPSVPARTLQELVWLAKTYPRKLNFGSGGVGSGSQLGAELFKATAKVEMVHVPYKGAAIAMTAMLSGDVDMVVSTVPATIAHIQSGRMRGLAVLAPKRVDSIADVPTTAEAGMPDVVVITWYGMFTRAGVKAEIIERLNGEIVKILGAPDTRNTFARVGVDAAPSSAAEFARFVRAETNKWAKVIRDAQIRVE